MKHADLVRALTDPAYSARIVGLRYQPDDVAGLARKKQGKSFIYHTANNKAITAEQRDRIAALVIPPAWKDVWISASPKGHIQVTGIDAKGRKQYRYHEKWSELHTALKYVRLAAFAIKLPALRAQMAKALKEEGLTRDKVTAVALDLIDELGIRVGNETYAKENGTYGVTTLQAKHVSLEGDTIMLKFTGKSHIKHDMELKDAAVAKILKKEKQLPGARLFQYVSNDGKRHPLTSQDVNAFIKESTQGDFTAKDFRTWIGTVFAYELLCVACKTNTSATTDLEYAKTLRTILKQVAERLGNTLAVTKSHYVHSSLQQRFCSGELPALRARARRMKKIVGLSSTESEVAAMLTLFAHEKKA